MVIYNKKPGRLLWVDLAKAYGMILVFYGHFLESLFKSGNEPSFLQLKFIHSFHIPLFFILAGYVYKSKKWSSFKEFFKYEFASRIVPVVFLNLIGLIFAVLLDLTKGDITPKGYIYEILALLRGFPAFSHITWFLICLFTVETIHFFLSRYIKTNKQLLVYGISSLIIGWIVIKEIEIVTSVTGIKLNFWYVHEALVAYFFYGVGIY